MKNNFQTQQDNKKLQLHYPKIDQIQIRSLHYYNAIDENKSQTPQYLTQTIFSKNLVILSSTNRRTNSLVKKINQNETKRNQTTNKLEKINIKNSLDIYQKKVLIIIKQTQSYDIQYDEVNNYLAQTQDSNYIKNFIHNDDIKLQQLLSPKQNTITSFDPNKYEKQGVFINYLAGYENCIQFVENFIPQAKISCQEFIQQKDNLKQEIIQLQKMNEIEIDQIQKSANIEIQKLHKQIQYDITSVQNRNFNVQKDIIKELRDKNQIEKQILQLKKQIDNLELQLYDEEVYTLKINDEYILNMAKQNLKPANQHQFKQIFH